jgi:uncharacterized membrane protein YidH (DUF202 family)
MIRRAPIRIQVAAAFAAAMAVVLLATGLARCASVMHIMDPELRRRMDRMYRNGAVAGVVGLVIVAVLWREPFTGRGRCCCHHRPVCGGQIWARRRS